MKNKLLIIFFLFIPVISFSQDNSKIAEFLPSMFLQKENLIAHYTNEEILRYDSFLKKLSSRTENNPEILTKKVYSDSIIYSEAVNFRPDSVVYHLYFNNEGQLTKWERNLTDCYDRYNSDMPSPMISNAVIQYNSSDKVDQISGSCASGEYAFQTNYFYSSGANLDSIIYRSGYSDLRIDWKVIFIDSALFSSESNGSAVLILNTPFDYKKWIKGELEEMSRNNKLYRELSRDSLDTVLIRPSISTYNHNHYYEFDSLGRTIRRMVLDENGYTPNDFDGLSPTIIELCYNEKGQLVGVDHIRSDMALGQSKHSDGGRMQILWKGESLREIKFYNSVRQVDSWSQQKGFESIPLTPVLSKKKQMLLIDKLDNHELYIRNELKEFPPDTVLIYSRFTDFYGNPDTTNKYFVKKHFFSWVLSDTVNSIIRYIWLQSDGIVDIFYVKNHEVIKAQHISTFGKSLTIYPLNKKAYLFLVESNLNGYNGPPSDCILDKVVYAYKKSRIVLPEDWEKDAYDYGRESRCYLGNGIDELTTDYLAIMKILAKSYK